MDVAHVGCGEVVYHLVACHCYADGAASLAVEEVAFQDVEAIEVAAMSLLLPKHLEVALPSSNFQEA
jgi:hypothetical protein